MAATPIGYDTYYRSIDAVIALFCAAQAPELFSRDQRHGVLALYFARALRRSDYAVARLAGFGLALLLLLLLRW
jgi:ABC-2 type transport system permease protein